MRMINKEELIRNAKNASENAYFPYSNYMVGAALLAENGKTYRGCNVENAGIQSICAERVAFTKAISEGELNFIAMAVVGKSKRSKEYELTLPCGYCREFINEFCNEEFKIFLCNEKDEIKEYTLKELLPHSFKFKKQ